MKIKRILIVIILAGLFPLSLYSQDNDGRILFFGDSITAGYGIEQQKAFPALIQQKIDSLDWNFEVINAGLSGETSAGGLRRVKWILRQPVDIFVLELGGNDGLRGIDLENTHQNLQRIIDRVEVKYPSAKIILAGMQVPPNLGVDYTNTFQKMYPELADKNDISLIPFLLKDVGGNPKLNQPDGIHPTAKGHQIIAQTTWDVLRPLLEVISKNRKTK